MKAAVLFFGGSSDERFVSVASAQNLAQCYSFAELWFFDQTGQIFLVSLQELLQHKQAFKMAFIPSQKSFALSLEQATDRLSAKTVFLGFHGAEGENGTIQAILERKGITFTGSDAKSSHLCFDKTLAKKALGEHGIPLAPELVVAPHEDTGFEEKLIPFFAKHGKIVVKPVANGSSIGLHIIGDELALDLALDKIAQSREVFLAEKFIAGRELTVGVIGEGSELVALPPSEVLLNAGAAFDYDGKYLGKGTQEITPAELSKEEKAAAQELAIKAHRLLACYGYSRTDMILNKDGLVFLETNTLPGLTKASFIPQQLAVAGIDVSTFIKQQLQLAEQR